MSTELPEDMAVDRHASAPAEAQALSEVIDDGTIGAITDEVKGQVFMTGSGGEALNVSKVLQEFEFDGKAAQIVLIAPDDVSDKDLRAHALNLAQTNAKPRNDIPNAAERQKKRDRVYRTRMWLRGKPLLRRLAKTDDSDLDTIYPDMSEAEHFAGYSDRENGSYTRRMREGRVIGVKVDGKIVAVQAYDPVGTTREGREVLEMCKASTLPEYKGKGINPILKKYLMENLKPNGQMPIWSASSANFEHIAKLQSRGWHVENMDAEVEPVRLGYIKNKTYIDANMIPQGYKALWYDPAEKPEEADAA